MRILREFRNVTEYLEYVQSPTDMLSKDRASVNLDRSGAWAGTRSLEEAVRLATNGWPEGLDEVQKVSLRLSENIITKMQIPEVTYDVTGDMLDIGRYVHGEPEDFMTLTPAEVEREPKVLHLVINVGASARVEPGVMIRRGAAAVALVDALEAHGKRCIVDCVSCSSPRGAQGEDCFEVRVRVKDADAPVQLANLVYMLAHPSSLRRLVFAAREHADEATRNRFGVHIKSDYGVSVEAEQGDQGDIYIGRLLGTWSEADAEAYVLEALKRQGIIVEDTERQPTFW